MSEKNGKLVTCDRCGTLVFCECTGEGAADGGYTRWNTFESLPDGWENINWEIEVVQHLCPACAEEWKRTKKEFMKGW